MADARLHSLSANAAPAAADIVPIQSGTAPMQKATLSAIASFLFPVGHVILSYVATSPATLYGFGTWALCAVGRFFVGIDSGDADFDVVGETGGAKTVTLTSAQMPVHTHVQDSHNHTQAAHSHLTQRYPTATGTSSGFTNDTSMSGTPAANTLPTQATTAVNNAATATNQNAGGGQAHPNLPPFEVIYKWRRVA